MFVYDTNKDTPFCISYPIIISYPILSYHIISYHISYRIISYCVISYHISYHIILYHVTSYHIISYHIILHCIIFCCCCYCLLSPLFNSLACRCNMKATQLNYSYFALQFYGECWTGPTPSDIKRYGPSKNCVSGSYHACNQSSAMECTGLAWTNYVYEVVKGLWRKQNCTHRRYLLSSHHFTRAHSYERRGLIVLANSIETPTYCRTCNSRSIMSKHYDFDNHGQLR